MKLKFFLAEGLFCRPITCVKLIPVPAVGGVFLVLAGQAGIGMGFFRPNGPRAPGICIGSQNRARLLNGQFNVVTFIDLNSVIDGTSWGIFFWSTHGEVRIFMFRKETQSCWWLKLSRKRAIMTVGIYNFIKLAGVGVVQKKAKKRNQMTTATYFNHVGYWKM